MKKKKIKEHINMAVILLGIMGFVCSCSGDSVFIDEGGNTDTEKKIFLSMALNSDVDMNEKSVGNIDDPGFESQIYRLDVLIFKSAGEYEAGKVDGHDSVPRTIINGNEYKAIDEIKGIRLTAGKRDIYVIANAPDGCFASVQNLTQFLQKYENLSTQGLFPHPGPVAPDPDDNPPIGGINPSDLKTNLTMCHYEENVEFVNTKEQHYLGYTSNNGRPGDVASDHGHALFGASPFLLERLVARVAIQKIAFDLDANMEFEQGHPTGNYTYHIDSVFMMNVKTASWFPAESGNVLSGKFGHGCNTGYQFLNSPALVSNLNPASQLTNYLTEPIFTQKYDITSDVTANDTPLWYYVFENDESTLYPTYFVIGVRYNFESTKDAGVIKTVKCYYPVIVNAPAPGKTTHDYIKRNYQYGIKATIKGLGTVYGNNAALLKSAQSPDTAIEIDETIGKNLFPWVGNTYQ
ncbi:fimbrial protein [Dysgonomonas termitidis]|uniref:Fimbrial protein n=1 Tax=Dysgonomonas termitidis TaxID=1516126 RepID=A0ABV9KUT3_9BACT